jgi:hypothetical protein
MALDWPLAIGHCYRPQRGCTCGDAKCPTPGAHPAPGPLTRLTEADVSEAVQTAPGVSEAVQTAPGASLITITERFDALVLPQRVAMAAMVTLDKISPVPCIIQAQSGQSAVLLVLPATGRYAAVNPRVEVRTGAAGWLALPPSNGLRWDTPPWIEPTSTARDLLHGADVGRALREVFNYATQHGDERAEVAR